MDLKEEFSQVYDNYFNKIFCYIKRSVFDKDTAEDITSNTFLKAYDYLIKNNRTIENYSSWLYKIATNELLMHYRYNKNKISVEYNDLIYMQNSEDRFEDYFMITNELEKLKPEEKLLIKLRYFEKLDYKEISSILEINENTLRSSIKRIVDKMNKNICREGGYHE